MLKRKNYWLLFAVLLLALTSLSPSMELNTDHGSYPPRQPLDQSERPPSGEAGEIQSLQIRVSLSTEEFSVLEQISKEYTLSSGVDVNLKNVEAEDGGAQIQQELTVGTSPDIVMLDGHSIYDLATRGYLLPVDIYQSVPGSTPLTMLIPQMQWNGYNWGVPLDIDPYVLVYSPERLAVLGVAEVPASLAQWNELLGRVKVDPEKKRYLLAMDTRNPYGYAAVLHSMGSSLLSAGLEQAQWTEAARSYFYLTSRFNKEIWELLQDGKVAVAAVPLSEWKKHGNSTLAVQMPKKQEGVPNEEVIDSRFLPFLPSPAARKQRSNGSLMSLQTRLSWNGWRTPTVCLHWLSCTAQPSPSSGCCRWRPGGSLQRITRPAPGLRQSGTGGRTRRLV